MEPYYHLTPPNLVERVELQQRRRIEALPDCDWSGGETLWGYHGSGPNTTAAAVLGDATGGKPIPLDRAIDFVEDVLSSFSPPEHHHIAVREVAAWWQERTEEPPPDSPAIWSMTEIQSAIELRLEGGQLAGWLRAYRAVHGHADVPSTGD
jgi:hypothetical protein